MEGQMVNPTWDTYSAERPHIPESLPPQSQASVPGMSRNVTNLRDVLAQHGGVERIVIRLLKSAPTPRQD